jgi:hypothetical protein
MNIRRHVSGAGYFFGLVAAAHPTATAQQVVPLTWMRINAKSNATCNITTLDLMRPSYLMIVCNETINDTSRRSEARRRNSVREGTGDSAGEEEVIS